jgi:hypothetical protein
MRTTLLVVGAAVAVSTPGAAGTGKDGRAALRAYEASYTGSRSFAAAHALIPAWARKYNMNCSGCHYPVPPRLNATGQRFKWAGYRMPEEIGEKTSVERIQNYVAGHGVVQYEWSKTEGQSANNVFAVPEAGLFFAGPFGRNFAGFLEFERSPDGTVDLKASVAAMWGKEHGYGGFRLGQMHAINEWGVAGFDRHVSVNDIAPISGGVTAAIPFVFDMAVGAEGYVVTGSNRLAAQVTNGIDRTGGVAPGGPGPAKDVALIDQVIYDSAGSGVEAVAYYGTLKGIDTLAAPNLNSHFWRLAFTANKMYRNVEVLGGVVYGQDFDLPTSLAFPNNEDKGLGWWASGQYYIPATPLIFFARYESVRPNTALANNTVHYIDLGTVLPINLPEYLRATLDYRLTSPPGGLPKTNDVITELQLNF